MVTIKGCSSTVSCPSICCTRGCTGVGRRLRSYKLSPQQKSKKGPPQTRLEKNQLKMLTSSPIQSRYSGSFREDKLAFDAEVIAGMLPSVRLTLSATRGSSRIVGQAAISRPSVDLLLVPCDPSAGHTRCDIRKMVCLKMATHIPSEDCQLSYTIHQVITFESCKFLETDSAANRVATLKTSKINLGYEPREKAIRMGMLSKVTSGERLNPCGDANCGANAVCVPNGDDSYDLSSNLHQ